MDEHLKAMIQWLTLGRAVIMGGEALWNEIKELLQKHNVEADTEKLDFVISDAARRKAMAEADAKGTI